MKARVLTTVFFVAVMATVSLAQTSESALKKCKADVQLNSDNHIVVRYLSAENEKIQIKVFNENEKLVFGKTIKKDGNIKVRFDMAELPQGTYYFKVYSNKHELCSEQVNKSNLAWLSIPERTNGKSELQQLFTQK